jgi:predicted phosphodiesterase
VGNDGIVRYGVLSDIHGNLLALRAAIDYLNREGVDEWLCAGDLIGYGPQPNECIETVAELEALCVAGNHELILLEELSEQRCGRLAMETIAWTRTLLREDCRSYLAKLPRVVTAPGLVMTHGSLDDPEEYVTHESQARQQLRQLEQEYPQARMLLLGHTHHAWLYSRTNRTIYPAAGEATPLPAPDRFLLNAGSVGQSRQREPWPQARFAILDLEPAAVRFHSTSYDVEACRTALRKHGLPRDCIHLRPGRVAAVQRRCRYLLRRSRRLPR